MFVHVVCLFIFYINVAMSQVEWKGMSVQMGLRCVDFLSIREVKVFHLNLSMRVSASLTHILSSKHSVCTGHVHCNIHECLLCEPVCIFHFSIAMRVIIITFCFSYIKR